MGGFPGQFGPFTILLSFAVRYNLANRGVLNTISSVPESKLFPTPGNSHSNALPNALGSRPFPTADPHKGCTPAPERADNEVHGQPAAQPRESGEEQAKSPARAREGKPLRVHVRLRPAAQPPMPTTLPTKQLRFYSFCFTSRCNPDWVERFILLPPLPARPGGVWSTSLS